MRLVKEKLTCLCGYEGEDFIELRRIHELPWKRVGSNQFACPTISVCPKCGTLKAQLGDATKKV